MESTEIKAKGNKNWFQLSGGLRKLTGITHLVKHGAGMAVSVSEAVKVRENMPFNRTKNIL